MNQYEFRDLIWKFAIIVIFFLALLFMVWLFMICWNDTMGIWFPKVEIGMLQSLELLFLVALLTVRKI